MDFPVDRRLGLTVGVGLLLLLVAVDGWIVRTIRQRPLDLGTFLLALLLVGSFFLGGLLLYWLDGLLRAGYNLDRNRLVIRWGATRQVIPMANVVRVIPGSQVRERVRFRGIRWPGYQVGYGEAETLGPVLFYVTAPLERQVWIGTEALTYAISPADLEGFSEALRVRLEMGPTQMVDQVSEQPAIFSWAFWSDRLGIGLLMVGGLLLLLLVGFLCWRYPGLPDRVPLRVNAAGEAGGWVRRIRVFYLPLIGLLTLFAG
ncbi:MAG: DUF1648 domain-containing protein, partial [Chloroflexi bacterium]